MPATAPPALKGDGHGRYRILIVGNSGTGKVTTRCLRMQKSSGDVDGDSACAMTAVDYAASLGETVSYSSSLARLNSL